VGARTKEEIGGSWSCHILPPALGDETSGEMWKAIGFVSSEAMRFRLRVFMTLHAVLVLGFVLAMALGIRDDTSGTSSYRQCLRFSRFGTDG
jgi:hypothetical protein